MLDCLFLGFFCWFFFTCQSEVAAPAALHCVDRMKEIQCDLFVEYEMKRGVGLIVRLFYKSVYSVTAVKHL